MSRDRQSPDRLVEQVDPATLAIVVESWVIVRSPLQRSSCVGHPLRMRLILLPAMLALAVLTGCASADVVHHPASSASASASASASGYRRLVLRDGDRIRATGQVVSVPHRPVRFCAPVAEASVGYAAGQEPAPQYCDVGVDLVGADLATLTDRREKDGAIEGRADITGVYRAGGVTVSKQAAPPPPGTTTPAPDSPPCPAPSGGWPRGPRGENINTAAASNYAARHPGSVQELAMLRPSENQVVALVLSTGDPAPIQAALQAPMRNRVCVVRTRYTKAQIAATSAAFRIGNPLTKAAHVDGTGHGLSHTGQPTFVVQLPVVTEPVAELADRQPAGLVVLDAWLTPISG